jgi:methyl-accepting chemotaxis protein
VPRGTLRSVIARLRVRSVRGKTVLQVMPIVALAIVVLTVVAVRRNTSQERGAVYDATAQLAQQQANAYDATVRDGLAVASTLANVVAGDSSGDRAGVNAMTRSLQLSEPRLLATYVQFEPNGFDGRDAANRNAPGSTKAGQFLPYWTPHDGKLTLGVGGGLDLPFFAVPKRTHRATVTEPFVWAKTLMTTYSAPIMRDGRFVGVGAVDRSLAAIDADVSKVKVLKSGYALLVSNDGVFVSAPRKPLIGTGSLARLATQRRDPQLRTVAAGIKAGRPGHVTTTDPFTGKRVVMFWAPVATGDWGFVTVAPESEILAGVNGTRDLLILIGAIALVLVGLAVFLIARRIAKPIEEVSAAAERIAVGDLDVDVRQRSDDEIGRMAGSFRRMVAYLGEMAGAAERIAGGDLAVEVAPKSDRDALGHAFAGMSAELRAALGDASSLEALVERLDSLSTNDLAALERALSAVAEGDLTVAIEPVTGEIVAAPGTEAGRLAAIFNEMLARVRSSVEGYNGMRERVATMVREIAQESQTVATSSQQMATTSDEAGRAVGEIAHAVGDVAGGAERQVRIVESAKGAAEKVVEAVRGSARHARETAAVADQARSAAHDGVRAAEAATEAMAAVRDSSQDVSAAIRELAAKSDRIGGIVKTITDIAQQTNLLALNAAIEAARAGEQGRGFAVVAEEVRKLAEGSQAATAEIGSLIDEIQAETRHAVAVVGDGARRTAESSETVHETRTAFESIGASVEDMARRVQEIAAAAETVAGTASGMHDEMTEVAAVAEQSSASAEQVSASTQQTSASTQEIAASAQELARTAEELERLVSRFTVAR